MTQQLGGALGGLLGMFLAIGYLTLSLLVGRVAADRAVEGTRAIAGGLTGGAALGLGLAVVLLASEWANHVWRTTTGLTVAGAFIGCVVSMSLFLLAESLNDTR